MKIGALMYYGKQVFCFALIPVLLGSIFSRVHGRQLSGSVPALPNTVYSAGGKCTFFDAGNQRLLSVDRDEAIWSVTPGSPQGFMAMFTQQAANSGGGRTFYVNTTGNNTDGRTLETAWRELDKVNSHQFRPSDTILFEGGKIFQGFLEFDSLDGNAAERPIILSSYGTGRATISTTVTTHCGLKASNTQGIWINNLIFKGPGSVVRKDIDGISFFTNRRSGYLRNVRITNCDVGQFGYCGIRFYSDWDSSVKAGFRDVIIDRCRVFDCMENGIVSSAYDQQEYTTYNHRNFIVRNTEVFDIRGYASSSHKGSGIVLSQLDSALIEHCVAYRCGTENTACGGPGGIWVWAANRVTIQFCESHHNSSGKPPGCDGLGFDLDGGVTNSVIQYCYSHDNDGAGILLGNFEGARPWGNNTVRYNLSINDARTNNSSVTLFTAPGTKWRGLRFYNNTIHVTPSDKNKTASFGAFQMTDYGSVMAGVECYNNIFQTSGKLPLLTIPASLVSNDPAFIGNVYWNTDGRLVFYYGKPYNTLKDFRTAGTFCEKLNGSDKGYASDPGITVPAGPLGQLYPGPNSTLQMGRLRGNSDAVDNGLDLLRVFGIDPGIADLYGNSLPSLRGFDIGAHELKTDLPNAVQNPGIRVYPNPLHTDLLYVNVPDSLDLPVELTMHHFPGQHILSRRARKGINTIDVRGLTSGMYIVGVALEEKREYFRIVRIR